MLNLISLAALGWRPFFQQQLSLEELEDYCIARVMEHHRSGYQLMTEEGTVALPTQTIRQ